MTTPDGNLPAAVLDAFAAHGLAIVASERLRTLTDAAARPVAGSGLAAPMWCVFEQLGHARYACLLTVETLAGVEILRLDVPDGDRMVTTYVGRDTVYAIRPAAEDVVRRLAALWGAPAPARPWELASEPEPGALNLGPTRRLAVDDGDDEIPF